MVFYLLFESSAGYALFERIDSEEIGNQVGKVQESWMDFGVFNSIIKLVAFRGFSSPESALENINDVSEGVLNPFLREFLDQNIVGIHTLGVSESSLGSSIETQTGIKCVKDLVVLELLRFVRYHFEKYIKNLEQEDDLLIKTQRGLSHSYSRAKIKFNVNKSDNMIIQSISLLDQLDKDINTFAMRVREWYSWHFPELVKIVNDNILYARVTYYIKNRVDMDASKLPGLIDIIGDEDKAKLILAACKTSMGYDIAEFDMNSVTRFAERLVKLAAFRRELSDYLHKKMIDIAPNLTTLVGDTVGARLINHAGSLTTLAKYPASTVQILGAEKALFRALKSRGNTPKYGLIYNSTFIGRAKTKDKGRISRYLANKCSIASRVDAFSGVNTTLFGESLRQQVEDRLTFYESGQIPAKNVDVMHKVVEQLKLSATETTTTEMEITTTTNGNTVEASNVEVVGETPLTSGSEEAKKEKRKSDKKKRKRSKQ